MGICGIVGAELKRRPADKADNIEILERNRVGDQAYLLRAAAQIRPQHPQKQDIHLLRSDVTTMPLYFFHMNIDGHLVRDEEGAEYADLEAAKVEGLASAADLFRDKLRRNRPMRNAHIEIVDKAGKIVATVPLDRFLN